MQGLKDDPISGFEDEAIREVIHRLDLATGGPEKRGLLLALANTIYRRAPLKTDTVTLARERIYESLEDADPSARSRAVYATAVVDGESRLKRLRPLLKDADTGTRMEVERMFGFLGNLDDARVLEEILADRKRGLTDEAISKDGSFRDGTEPIAQISKRI